MIVNFYLRGILGGMPYHAQIRQLSQPLDIIVATPDEIERRKNIIGTIIRPALRDGRLLYAKN